MSDQEYPTHAKNAERMRERQELREQILEEEKARVENQYTLEIDPDRLDQEWEEQPARFLYFAELSAEDAGV